MKKKILALSLAVASLLGTTAATAQKYITVNVNGNTINFAEQFPFIENDFTLVPMREIFEALGATVSWDGENQSIYSYDPVSDVSIIMQINSDTMFVNGTAIKLDVPAKIVGTSTVVPVRAISEGMNSKVDWEEVSQTVIIEKEIDKD